jgi:hypothetical protein
VLPCRKRKQLKPKESKESETKATEAERKQEEVETSPDRKELLHHLLPVLLSPKEKQTKESNKSNTW